MPKVPLTTVQTYPLREVTRLTGLSAALIRAWEQRHGAVRPMRTPGGTRRYTAGDIERLRLLKSAVDAGHRIGEVASFDATALSRLSMLRETDASDGLSELLAALERLDATEVHRLLAIRLATMGAVPFAKQIAAPLAFEMGERWARGEAVIATEHLITSVLRTLLGSALQPSASAAAGPRIVFATPTGERHEIGLLMAALTATGAGSCPLYLGCELPVEELVSVAKRTKPRALALSLVTLPLPEAQRLVEALCAALPSAVEVWIGGPLTGFLDLPDRARGLASLEDLEQQVGSLRQVTPHDRELA